MDRMKTFGMYALWIIAFFFFSVIVSNVLIENSYTDLKSNIEIASSEDGIKIETTEVKTNKMQGFFKGKVTNNSNKTIPLRFMRIKSYSSGGSLLQTKYIRLENLEPGETREFSARFDVGDIDRYEVDYVDEMPDDRTFLDKMFENVNKFLKSDNKMESLKNDLGFKPIDENLPNWAWFTAAMMVLYYIPSGAIWFII